MTTHERTILDELTVAEWALLIELERGNGSVTRHSMLNKLDDIRKEREAREDEKAKTDRADNKYGLVVLKAAVAKLDAEKAKIEAENEKERLAQKWTFSPWDDTIEASEEKAKQMEKRMKQLNHQRLLALAIRQQHIELVNALKALEEIEVKQPIIKVEAPDAKSYGSGGGGKRGSKNVKELFERQRAYFGR